MTEKGHYQFEVAENPGGLNITHKIVESGGITYIQVHINSGETKVFPAVTCKVIVPACEVHDIWTPKIHLIKALNLDWFEYLKKTNGFTGAPVQCLIGTDDCNCAALGLSDTLNTFGLYSLPVEETGEYAFVIELFGEECRARDTYDLTIRLDMRRIPYYDVLRDMSLWWEQDQKNVPAYVPARAKEPMYSTWYSYHQMLSEEALIKECELAKKLGCKSILLDDGWQTDDSDRGYAYCGDWQPAPSKIPDMKKFTERIHGLGMKVIPWYSLPFIGEKSANFERFKDMLIDPDADRTWHVLDPRYPEVREFILTLFEQALEKWDVDGFKMDFIDEFVVTPFSGIKDDQRRDFESFHEASDCMMKECIARLKAQKPDILLEFRQTYNGPMMRSYGNIFRAVDCPFDAVENHVRVTDIRLLCGDSAVHSDMIMWNPQDTPESAALQIINILFSVPQISMRLGELSEEHQRMLAFYCRLWKQYQNAFINGKFEPLNPIERYNVVKGNMGQQFVCTYHSSEVIFVDKLYSDMLFVNGSAAGKLYVDNESGAKEYRMTVYNCQGEIQAVENVQIVQGLNVYSVPASGAAIFKEIMK